jgi:hypothetical protein
VAQLAQDTLDEWTPVRPKKKSQTCQTHSHVPIRVRGSKDVSSSTVRIIPRQDVLSAYVERIHPDTIYGGTVVSISGRGGYDRCCVQETESEKWYDLSYGGFLYDL